MDNVILRVHNLQTQFTTREGTVKAVNGVSFELKSESVLGLVGESGSGKTVTALSVLRLVQSPGRIVSGEVYFEGRDLMTLSDEEMRHIRGRDISMIFQDPTAALNPVIEIGRQVDETIMSHLNVPKAEARRLALEALHLAGLPSPERIVTQYPFHLSGGMCQRVMIAIAMALKPKVLIADEPTSALDVTTQAEILVEIEALKSRYHSSILLITHDLGVLAKMADEVAVMYAGSVVEQSDVITIFKRPRHPYTVALLATIPRLDNVERSLRTIRGTPPTLIDLPDECAFLPRCNKATSQCRVSPNPSLDPVEENHWVACYNRVTYPEEWG